MGKAIPPPKDRLPTGGNYKEMPEGVQRQRDEDQDQYDHDGTAHSYVNDHADKVSGGEDEDEEEEAY